MDARKKHGWAFWLTVALFVLLVVYPLSYPPVFRLWLEGRLPASALRIYRPLYVARDHSPAAVRDAWNKYVMWWMDGVRLKPRGYSVGDP